MMTDDDEILSQPETAEMTDLSVRTLQRLGPEGPRKLRLSTRRIGYRRGDVRTWLDRRAAKPAADTP
jgi:predicted DNA-binding transcriptional regulator AlpA